MKLKRGPHDPERSAAEYVSGELSNRATRWFENHLLDCEDCWREVLLGRLGRSAAEETRESAPASLRERVRASVQLTGESGTVRRRSYRRPFRGRDGS